MCWMLSEAGVPTVIFSLRFPLRAVKEDYPFQRFKHHILSHISISADEVIGWPMKTRLAQRTRFRAMKMWKTSPFDTSLCHIHAAPPWGAASSKRLLISLQNIKEPILFKFFECFLACIGCHIFQRQFECEGHLASLSSHTATADQT